MSTFLSGENILLLTSFILIVLNLDDATVLGNSETQFQKFVWILSHVLYCFLLIFSARISIIWNTGRRNVFGTQVEEMYLEHR